LPNIRMPKGGISKVRGIHAIENPRKKERGGLLSEYFKIKQR